MGIKVNWYDKDKTIVRYEFEGQWRWDDLHEAIKQVNALLESVNHPVYIIIDVTEGTIVPAGAFSHMRMRSMNAAPNWAGGIFVGMNTFLKTLITTFIKVYPKLGERYAVCNTMDEALAVIAEKRGSK